MPNGHKSYLDITYSIILMTRNLMLRSVFKKHIIEWNSILLMIGVCWQMQGFKFHRIRMSWFLYEQDTVLSYFINYTFQQISSLSLSFYLFFLKNFIFIFFLSLSFLIFISFLYFFLISYFISLFLLFLLFLFFLFFHSILTKIE